MTGIAAAPTNRMGRGLTILRVAVGTVLSAHGAQKLLAFGLAGVTGAFGQMHSPLPALSGPAIAPLEFFGRIALVIGLFTRVVAVLLACAMLGAILFVHLRN